MKGVTYVSAPLSVLFLIMSSSGDEQCKFVWGMLPSVFSVLLLTPYWNALVRNHAQPGSVLTVQN
ncbi:MAG: hypothetical protein CMP20_15350 [Rickettsiales bacterium]|nr:hypothetical protein [Rickettsiales bacterium]